MTGISEAVITSEISLYPNPSSTVTTFQFSHSSTSREIISTDQLGREIWRNESSESIVEFPAGEFFAGMYFYRIEQKGKISASGKLLIN